VAAIFLAGAAGWLLTAGEERAEHVLRRIGRHLPRVHADRLGPAVRRIGDSLVHLLRSPAVLRRAVLWAALNWVLDAASLWSFVAAFGARVHLAELFVAYGVANVLAVIPVVPAGLGIIEATTVALLADAGVGVATATYGVLAWRLVNFWLPIPVGAVCFVSLRLPRRAGWRSWRRALAGVFPSRRHHRPPGESDLRRGPAGQWDPPSPDERHCPAASRGRTVGAGPRPRPTDRSEGVMTATTAEQRADWARLADRLSAEQQGREVTIEVLDPDGGDNPMVERLPFDSIVFDARTDVVIVSVGGRGPRYPVVLRHLVHHPREILVDDIPRGTALKISDQSGTTTLISLLRPAEGVPGPRG
jgi:hypothetical protein